MPSDSMTESKTDSMTDSKIQVCVSMFDNSTEKQFWQHPSLMGHSTKVHIVFPGDIVLIYNKDTQCVTGIAILNAIENGKIYRTSCNSLYSSEYKKYNAVEIGVTSYPIDPVPLRTINLQCGLHPNSPIVNGHHISFKRNQNLISWAKTTLLNARTLHIDISYNDDELDYESYIKELQLHEYC